MEQYRYVPIDTGGGFFSGSREHRAEIGRWAAEGWRYTGFFPVAFTSHGGISSADLIFRAPPLPERGTHRYEYKYLTVETGGGFLSGSREYQAEIGRCAAEGWQYVGFFPVAFTSHGGISSADLIFEREQMI